MKKRYRRTKFACSFSAAIILKFFYLILVIHNFIEASRTRRSLPCHFACASKALLCRGSAHCVETADERSDATLRRVPFGKPQTERSEWRNLNKNEPLCKEISPRVRVAHLVEMTSVYCIITHLIMTSQMRARQGACGSREGA